MCTKGMWKQWHLQNKLSVQHEKYLYSVRYLHVKLGLGWSCCSVRIFENTSTALYNGHEIIVLLLLIIVEQGNKLISSLADNHGESEILIQILRYGCYKLYTSWQCSLFSAQMFPLLLDINLFSSLLNKNPLHPKTLSVAITWVPPRKKTESIQCVVFST